MHSMFSHLPRVMEGYAERADVPGIVTVVAQGGDVSVDTFGVATLGGTAVARDTIFRLSSLTKPVTAAAAMVLVDDGAMALDEPVDRLLPELTGSRVLRGMESALNDTTAATRPIQVRDVLNSCMGVGLVLAPPDKYPIQRALTELGVVTGPPKPQTALTPDEWMRRLGSVPLMHDPGEQWMYDTSSDVLGVLIARASGKSFEAFLGERLFEPLGMGDTGFYVPADKLSRFTTCYQAEPGTGALRVVDGVEDSQWRRPPSFPAGRTGLVSTANDYLAFASLLLNHGLHGRERVLSQQSVALMTTNQTTDHQRRNAGFLSDGQGWGFGMAVTPDWYGWDGGYGTSWRTYPGTQTIGILLTQRLTYPRSSGIEDDFWKVVDQPTAE
jgi:CubicO group peptidase (beta-lactamase class C family)